MFFNIRATFAEFEVDLLRMRTGEGMAVARAKGKLRVNSPCSPPKHETELRRMHASGDSGPDPHELHLRAGTAPAGKRREADATLSLARDTYLALGASTYVERCDRELKASGLTKP